MKNYYCLDGQSFSDVCLATYQTLDKYAKMLNDNGIDANSIPYTAQLIIWDDLGSETATIATSTVVFSPTAYNTAPEAFPANYVNSIAVASFLTTAGKFIYSKTDAPELSNLVGKKIFLAFIDDTRLLASFRNWDNINFTILNFESIEDDSEVIILAK